LSDKEIKESLDRKRKQDTLIEQSLSKEALEISKSLEPIKKSSSNKQTKNWKVQLMKLKLKAQGDSSIPTPNRVYLHIKIRKDSGETEEKMLYFHKSWVVGRVVDRLVSLSGSGLVNRNHLLPNPNDPDVSVSLFTYICAIEPTHVNIVENLSV
jgi:hypothetical protein